jgi:catechol 2,3-dioxygenase-like lactoylglutathione lyase family enzyme
MSIPILRIARPTSSLERTLHFYQTALGLHLIASFENHSGFDGRILAPTPQTSTPAPWHLEFTYQHPRRLSASAEGGRDLINVEAKEANKPTSQPARLEKEKSKEEGENCKPPTKDNLLVLYLPEREEWKKRKARMEENGYESVESVNPYWDVHGVTFEDWEGWRVVLVNDGWYV